MRRAFGRFCKGDLGWVVRDDLYLPVAERRAGLRHSELLTGRQGRGGPEVLLVDRIEVAALPVNRETRNRLAAMHLGEQLAAGRDTQHFRSSGAQELRRLPGVVGR